MITVVRIIFLLLCMAIGKAQSSTVDIDFSKFQFDPSSNFYTKNFSYPAFMDNEMHTQSTLGYELDEKFLVELRNYYDTYRDVDFYQLALEFKYYPTDNFYLVNGIRMERALSKYDNEVPKPQFMMTNGVGYDVNKNFMMEARHDLNITKEKNKAVGKSSMFSVLSKIKF